jgi:CubicO group peptidase (beta-lactamase class C family)
MNQKALERALVYADGWLKYGYERGNLTGFVVAVSYKGKLLFSRAYGYANLEKKELMTPDNIFRIASHSKTFTATAIMQLQEQGLLKIDDKIVKYLPWLQEHKDKRWQKVTIRQLLSHGAGVIRDGLDQSYWSLGESFPEEKKFIENILATDLVLDTNIKMKYSNYGYTLLGLIIKAVSGQPYNEYVVKNIVEPLGLRQTGPELSNSVINKLVTGYSRLNDQKRRLPIMQIDTHVMSPATGLAQANCLMTSPKRKCSGLNGR